mmetsp:Transcript_24649/g.67294  ORF Transcript_24649/g.67294 Transcript_24649/m.67294 type:complete len:178 (-) Transcript_24649:46-579(-)|eukprot:CAMPEP_0171192604 /NCGR_PEP_ID=MMETSP0790-20130122/19953_1 /TAXON_ID=2925 /ORGANISM="Alexandrium catenella, Strain OF101" /LENGTH=177 /DNA_ID=CAMNT_0011657763 /DNA_START=81 /DNA_END=614 /DNA_ORIENTATION=-
MARAVALPFAVALLLMPSRATVATPGANATLPALRSKTASLRDNATVAVPLSKSATLPVRADFSSCTADDEARMASLGAGSAPGTFPYLLADCGKNSWSLFGGFNKQQYSGCVVSSTRISAPCASCFSHSGDYGYRNCKFDCLFGSWCGRACLNCVAPSTPAVKACAGVPIPDATPC